MAFGRRADRPDDQPVRRDRMVDTTVVERGVTDRRVVDAMRAVHRELFLGPDQATAAYEDHPLPIGSGQTISQPYIVALMAEAARIGPNDRVLEVGTGSGYGAGILSQLAASVVSVERIDGLAEAAREALAEHGITNVEVQVGDGSLGWPEAAPFDAVIVTAAAAEVPPTLIDQLADGGRLVIPVGRQRGAQRLVCLHRRGDAIDEQDLGGVAFVPLISGT